jgi:hypothetical protein
MASLTLDNGTLVYRTPYNPGLVGALKAAIPATDRKWDPRRKVWLVAPSHGQTLATLTAQYLGVQLSVPAPAAISPTRETRVLEVRYIGATKDRGDGNRTSFGYVAGEWNVIFPEAALKRWFAVETKPGDEATLYNVLGIKQLATDTEVRSAYRRLARQWHPDVCKEPDAHEQFIRIQRAYEVLNDPRSRGRYDAGLALAVTVRLQEAFDVVSVNYRPAGYRPPLRCGLIMATGIEQLGRFIVDDILAWEDLVDDRGRTLVTSWPVGADTFEEAWV